MHKNEKIEKKIKKTITMDILVSQLMEYIKKLPELYKNKNKDWAPSITQKKLENLIDKCVLIKEINSNPRKDDQSINPDYLKLINILQEMSLYVKRQLGSSLSLTDCISSVEKKKKFTYYDVKLILCLINLFAGHEDYIITDIYDVTKIKIKQMNKIEKESYIEDLFKFLEELTSLSTIEEEDKLQVDENNLIHMFPESDKNNLGLNLNSVRKNNAYLKKFDGSMNLNDTWNSLIYKNLSKEIAAGDVDIFFKGIKNKSFVDYFIDYYYQNNYKANEMVKNELEAIFQAIIFKTPDLNELNEKIMRKTFSNLHIANAKIKGISLSAEVGKSKEPLFGLYNLINSFNNKNVKIQQKELTIHVNDWRQQKAEEIILAANNLIKEESYGLLSERLLEAAQIAPENIEVQGLLKDFFKNNIKKIREMYTKTLFYLFEYIQDKKDIIKNEECVMFFANTSPELWKKALIRALSNINSKIDENESTDLQALVELYLAAPKEKINIAIANFILENPTIVNQLTKEQRTSLIELTMENNNLQSNAENSSNIKQLEQLENYILTLAKSATSKHRTFAVLLLKYCQSLKGASNPSHSTIYVNHQHVDREKFFEFYHTNLIEIDKIIKAPSSAQKSTSQFLKKFFNVIKKDERFKKDYEQYLNLKPSILNKTNVSNNDL